MALFNEINVGRYNRFFQKLFGLKGGPPVPQLASEVAPSFPLFSGVENRYLEGWDRYGLAVAPVAVAAPTSIRFRNPVNSNVIAVIELLDVSFATADTAFSISRGTATVDLGTVPSGTLRMDARGRQNPTCINSNNNGAGAAAALTGSSAFFGGQVLASTMLYVIGTETQELPVLPGDAIQITAGGNAYAVGCSIFWRERALEEGERT